MYHLDNPNEWFIFYGRLNTFLMVSESLSGKVLVIKKDRLVKIVLEIKWFHWW
jgi:hypothetical protein